MSAPVVRDATGVSFALALGGRGSPGVASLETVTAGGRRQQTVSRSCHATRRIRRIHRNRFGTGIKRTGASAARLSGRLRQDCRGGEKRGKSRRICPVSYTHLTLPTS